MDFYQLLQVGMDCSFEELRSAYRRLAKSCHPDLFGNDPGKTAEFQQLVHAFDVLSDPQTRREYDRRMSLNLNLPAEQNLRTFSVMDTVADDILEELMVGRELHRITSLQSLMLDLARTERFILFRQARCLYDAHEYSRCARICSTLVSDSPDNILYHFYYGEALRHQKHYRRAEKQFRICIQLGEKRNPPQMLRLAWKRYNQMRQHKGWFGKLLDWFFAPEEKISLSDDNQLRRSLEREFRRHHQQTLGSSKNKRKLLR